MLVVTTCSDDFLARNEVEWYYMGYSDSLFLTSYHNDVVASIDLPENIDSEFTIFQHPKWLSFNSLHGKVINGRIPLSFSIVKDYTPSPANGSYSQLILDIEDFGVVSIMVYYMNYGNPTLQCFPPELNIISTTYNSFRIANTTEGMLLWEIVATPPWLTVSDKSGYLTSGSSIGIGVHFYPDLAAPGSDLTGNILIRSNSVLGDYVLDVIVTTPDPPPPDVNRINGKVIDAEYHHDSGIMAICTKSPDQILIFNTFSGSKDSIRLNFPPACVSLSEDGQKAVVGYSIPAVSYLDLNNREIIADYDLDCIPYDIVLGENGWCYINPLSDNFVRLRNLNLNTRELIITRNDFIFHGKTIIKKIPGKPFLVGSRIDTDPSCMLIIDVTRGIAAEDVTFYHMPVGEFWISHDGNRIFTGVSRYVYALPEYDGQFHSTPPQLIGRLESDLNSVIAFEDCPATGNIFAACGDYSFAKGYYSVIDQYDPNSLNRVNSFNLSPLYKLSIDGLYFPFEMSPHFIFAETTGSTLYVIEKPLGSYGYDYWTIELININGPGR